MIGFVGYHKRNKKGADVLSAVGAYKNFCSREGKIKIDLSIVDGRNSTAGMHMFDPVESSTMLTPFEEGGTGVSNAVLLIVIVACTVVLVVPVVICIFLLANNGKKPLFEGAIDKHTPEDMGDTFESQGTEKKQHIFV